MRGEPDAGLALHVGDELVQHPHAVAVADDLRVHGQNVQRALVVGAVEFVFPDGVHVVRVAQADVLARPTELEQRPVVENPLHRQLHESGVFSVGDQTVGPVVRHHAAFVQKAHVLHDADGRRRQVPGRGPEAGRTLAHLLHENLHGLGVHRALLLFGQRQRVLVDVGMKADFIVGMLLDLVDDLRVEHHADRGDEERGGDVVFFQQRHDARHADACAIFAARHVRWALLALKAHPDRLGVHVEGEAHGHAIAIGPLLRGQISAPADGRNVSLKIFGFPLPERNFLALPLVCVRSRHPDNEQTGEEHSHRHPSERLSAGHRSSPFRSLWSDSRFPSVHPFRRARISARCCRPDRSR